MDIQKIINEIQRLAKELSEKTKGLSQSAQPDGTQTKEMEELCLALQKNILSLGIIEELKSTFNTREISDKPLQENDVLENQLEMDFFNIPAGNEEKSKSNNFPDKTTENNATSKTPLQALKIGVNDKFRFIKDLFDGNAQEYNIAINQFNTIENKTEAIAYTESLKNIYRWKNEKENECLALFIEIINKRFS